MGFNAKKTNKQTRLIPLLRVQEAQVVNKSEGDRTATVPSSVNFRLRVQKVCSWNTCDESDEDVAIKAAGLVRTATPELNVS